MKRFIYLFVALSLIISCCGCTGTLPEEEKTIVDINGDTVSVPALINNIICRSGNGTSFIVAMGYGDKLAGTADYVVTNPWTDKFFNGISSLPTFGWAPSAEEIYRVNADLVMLADPDCAASLRADGINALCYKQYNETEIIDSVRLLGNLLGKDAADYAERWIDYYNETDEFISQALSSVSAADKPNVYYIYGQTNKGLGRTAGGGSIEQFWIEEAGGVFVTQDLANDGPKITEEEAISRNPDVIFIGGIYSGALETDLQNNPAWSDVSAVKNARIYQIPVGFLPWDFYGVEFPLLKLWAAKQLYPNLIDVDMHEITKEFYKEFYNKELTDNEVEYILNSLSPEGKSLVG